MTSVVRPRLPLNSVKPDFSPTLDALSARDISSIDHVLTGKGVEKGFATDEFVSFFIEDRAKLDLHKRGYTIRAKVFIENLSLDVPVHIFDLKNGHYRVSYRRDTPGTYLIDVWLLSSNKQQIPTASRKVVVDAESPYDLKYQETLLHCLDPGRTSIILQERSVEKGHSYAFIIQTRNWKGAPIREGGARFAATLSYLTDKSEIPTKIMDRKDGTYVVNFQPLKSGRYKLDVHLLAHKNAIVKVHGSPLEATLILSHADVLIDTRHTCVDKNLLRGKRVNEPITILIQAKDKLGNNILVGGGSFVAHISSVSGGDSTLRVIDNEDGTYSSVFKAKTSGNYNLNVKFCEVDNGRNTIRHLHGSPFSFSVAAAEFDLAPSLTVASGPGLVGGQTGRFTHFTVTPKNKKGEAVKECGSQLFVKITYGLAVKEIFPEIRDENGTYIVSYCPKFHGRHKIYVYLVDDKQKRLPINGSPFIVDIDPPTHVPVAAYSSAFGLGLQMCKIQHETKFFIQARNNSRGEITVKPTDFTAYLVGSNRKRIDVNLSENADGTLTASYTVTTAGSYKLFILTNEDAIFENEEDRYIAGVPFTIEALDVVDVTKCKVSGLAPDAQYLLCPTTFKIDAKNKDGEALITGGEQFDVIIQGPKGPLNSNIYDKSDGTYDVTFVPKFVGIHKIWVSHEGKDLVGCPFIIDVDEAADSTQSSTVQYMFVVQMRTKSGANKTTGGDFFEATVEGPDGPVEEVHVLDVGDGSVLVKYSLTPKPAEYWVKVVLNGKVLNGFPFLHVMPLQ